MVKDQQNEKTQGKQIIEALISNGIIRVWIPVMVTKLYLVSKEGEITPITEVRVRDLGKEEK